MSFDQTLFNFLHQAAGTSAFLDFFGVFLASYLGYFFVLAAFLWFFLEKDWKARFYKFALVALAAILARGILTEIVKFAVQRPRPGIALKFVPLIDAPESFAFPSGHAAFFFALASAVWLRDRRWGNYLLVAAALISIARVFVGVHWPTDVLAGAAIGIASAFAVRELLTRTRA